MNVHENTNCFVGLRIIVYRMFIYNVNFFTCDVERVLINANWFCHALFMMP